MSRLDPGPVDDLDAEIEHHIQERAELLMAQGMEADAAWAEARRRFGNPNRVRAEVAEIHAESPIRVAVRAVGSWGADLRGALRSVARAPAFSLAVVVTLALGAAGATSIFAVVDAVLLRPLAYADADRWMEVNTGTAERFYPGQTVERFQAWREVGGDVADSWIGYVRRPAVRIDGTAEPLSALAITPGAVEALGVRLQMGRGFATEDGEPGSPDVVILSRAYWERIGADPGILGRTLRFESGPATVVGVLAESVKVPDHGPPSDIWIPIRDDFTAAGRALAGLQGAWARRVEGVPLAAVPERVEAITASLAEERPGDTEWSVHMTPVGRYRAAPNVTQGLWILAVTVGLLLVIALVSAVNLVLVRTSGRLRELAVRGSLGGSRSRIRRQLVGEGLVLGAVAAGVAILLAAAGIRALTPVLPSALVFFAPHTISVDGRTMVFAVGLTLVAGLVLGLVPSAWGVRMDLLTSSRTGGDPPSARRVRRGLVATQIALSTVLLVVASLLARSLSALLDVDPGFAVDEVAVLEFQLPDTRYATPGERADFVSALSARLEAIPGVIGVGVGSGAGFSFDAALETEAGVVPEEQPLLIPSTSVTAGYLGALGYELEEGRGFQDGDRGQPVAIVDRDLATFLWGAEPAVGRRFRIGDRPWKTVVGVVGELRLMGRDQRDGPYQILHPMPEEGPGAYFQVGVRARGEPDELLAPVRAAVAEVDSWLPLIALRTAEAALAEEEDRPRFLLLLTTMLAGMAVVLASIGLYGVLAFTVRQRTRELGVRMALGAPVGRVRRMVLRDGIRTAGFGIALGIVAALLAADTMASVLYEIPPRDVGAFSVTAVVLGLVALAASYLPARRATHVDPAEALRAE